MPNTLNKDQNREAPEEQEGNQEDIVRRSLRIQEQLERRLKLYKIVEERGSVAEGSRQHTQAWDKSHNSLEVLGSNDNWEETTAPIESSNNSQDNSGSTRKMAHNSEKQKLPRFNGLGSEDPARHCKTCVTIWQANGEDDEDNWLKAFPATLRGIAIDWYTDLPITSKDTWKRLAKAFEEEFRLLRDDDEIVVEIYNTKQGKSETVRSYYRKLKELIGKMDNTPADGLKKRWFIEGLQPSLRKKMKVVPPSTFMEAYNRAMDIESENKTSKGKKRTSDEDSSD